MSKFWDGITEGQKEAIIEFIASLDMDDAKNSIKNATRCLNEQGVRELEVMASNYYYRAGINAAKNELREIFGLPRLMTDREKRELEYALKHPMGSRQWWNCPELKPHEFEIVEGSAKLIPLGDDGVSMVVIGTKDRRKAARMMRRCQRDWLDTDLLVEDHELEPKKLVWREAGEEDGEHTHMFSWSKKDTKNNQKAVDAFIYEG